MNAVATEDSWRVLHVVANHEKRVAQYLTSRNLENYLPVYAVKSRWSDRTVTLQLPLFPGYVFTRFDCGRRIAVLGTPGVLNLLGTDALGGVSAQEIDRIREALAAGHALRPHPVVTKGTRVRVRGGVFEGWEGVVSELRGQCRVVLTMKAIHQCFSLCVESSDLEVAQEPAPERNRSASATANRARTG